MATVSSRDGMVHPALAPRHATINSMSSRGCKDVNFDTFAAIVSPGHGPVCIRCISSDAGLAKVVRNTRICCVWRY